MKKRNVALAAGIVGLLGVGTVGGAAVAAGPLLLTPVGVQAVGDVAATEMPKPNYAVNERGQTYGSAADAPAPELEPDLIRAQARNGKVGYVRKADLDNANGSAAASIFKSPEEALAWQQEHAGKDVTVPVYAVDGKTVIGEFVVTAPGQVTEE